MDPKLRDLIYEKKLHLAQLQQITPLLPADDEGLDALVGEAVAGCDVRIFLPLVLAALHAGRPVQARHLAGGTQLSGCAEWLAVIAWRMEGDVAEHLMSALDDTLVTREQQAAAMLLITAWSLEHREGRLPPGLTGLARIVARQSDLNAMQLGCLWSISEKLHDADLDAILRTTHPKTATPLLIKHALSIGEGLLAHCHLDLTSLIPVKPDADLPSGTHVRRAVARVGRNDPCPCGSGQKYKRCCEQKDKERLRHSSVVAGLTMSELMAEPEPHLTPALLKGLGTHGVARLDVTKVPPKMITPYLMALHHGLLMEQIAVAFEKLGCETTELQMAWDQIIQDVGMKQRLDIARRMIRARYQDAPPPDTLPFRVRLLLVREEPERYLKLINDEAKKALESADDTVRMEFAYALLHSPLPALGIHCARAMIPLIGKKLATKLLPLMEYSRDRLGLPQEEPYAEILERRFSEEIADGGKDAHELRQARARLEAKAGEVNQLKERVEQLRRSVRLQEKKAAPATPAQPAPAEPQELRDLRQKLNEMKAAITERNHERATLRRELGQAYADLQELRARQPAATAPETPDAEDALLLPGEVDGNQPPRPIEFPRKFNDTLAHLPRQAGRAALVLLGRIAAGEPTAFAGAVRLRAATDVLRVRIGADHRLLFRLLPDRVQVVDLINRRDLERCISGL